ncbi:sigma-70 family RNA polymerase sigma factor [Paenibacillus pabuli]|uniref:sigma-70 family RNA polymerase sigma factor n=1 Tax=Paenibacillus pabuli TaxID=1472 RepID=UPI003242E719
MISVAERPTKDRITTEDELDLIYKVKSGDDDAFNKLVKAHIGSITKVCKSVRTLHGTDYNDKMQIALLTFYETIINFDPDSGNRLMAYSYSNIKFKLLNYNRDTARLVRLSRPQINALNKFGVAYEEACKQFNRDVSFQEVSDITGIDYNDYITASSLNSPDHLDRVMASSERETATLADMIPGVYDEYADFDLYDAIASLKPLEKQVIVLTYFENKTQREIAEITGYSQMHICRVKNKTLLLLKTRLEGKGF